MRSPVSSSQRFPKSSRLKQPVDFIRVRRHGKRAKGPNLRLIALPRERVVGGDTKPTLRLGVVLSRRVGKAHVRNLWRRRIKEIFRCEILCDGAWQKVDTAFDFVVVVHQSKKSPHINKLKEEFKRLIQEIKTRHHMV